jgi:hypothetical protein
MTNLRGPLPDTPLTWGKLDNGKLFFKGTLGGFPRCIVGKTRGELEAMAEKMRANLA